MSEHRRQVEIKIDKNDYLTLSFIGNINFAGRWYGTAEILRDKLRTKSEQGVRLQLNERNVKALERVIGFVFSYRTDLSEESQEDLKLADDLYHVLKKELRKQVQP